MVAFWLDMKLVTNWWNVQNEIVLKVSSRTIVVHRLLVFMGVILGQDLYKRQALTWTFAINRWRPVFIPYLKAHQLTLGLFFAGVRQSLGQASQTKPCLSGAGQTVIVRFYGWNWSGLVLSPLWMTNCRRRVQCCGATDKLSAISSSHG